MQNKEPYETKTELHELTKNNHDHNQDCHLQTLDLDKTKLRIWNGITGLREISEARSSPKQMPDSIIYQPIINRQSFIQSINKSIDQSITQSINQSITD